MKLFLLLFVIILSTNYGKSDHIHIVTADPYQWFPLRTNNLHFHVKAKQNVYVRLSSMPNWDPPYYKFVIGDGNNTSANIKIDTGETLVQAAGEFLDGSKYKAFTITLNEPGGTLKLLGGRNQTILEFHDTDFMMMSHFGISTLDGIRGDWLLDFDAVFPSK